MTTHENFPWFRQIPGGGGCIGEWRFTLNEIAEDCALVVVYDESLEAFECPLPASRRILITTEPPGMKRYHARFANQFGHLMGPVDVPGFTGKRHITHPALNWFYGIGFTKSGVVANLDYEDLAALPPPEKQEAVSIILSKKAKLPKHRARLAFVAEVQRLLGARVRVFGRGFEEVADKAEAITPFAYHIVLENNDIPHFWTEKTADSLLGWALPIFSGCTNISDHFPAEAFIPLDISDPQAAALRVQAILEEAPYSARLPALAAARTKLLEEHNLFVILAKWAEGMKAGGVLTTAEELEPNAVFAPILTRLAKALRKHLKRS